MNLLDTLLKQSMARMIDEARNPPSPEEVERRRQAREARIERARQEAQATQDRWTRLTATLDGPLRTIADQHAPHWYRDTSTRLDCQGCDQGCNCDDAEWPCTTAEIILDAYGEE